MIGIGVLGDVEIFLDDTSRVGEEWPVGADSAAIFIRQSDIVGADRDQPAIANLKLTMEFNQPFRLPAILGTETSAAEDENHGMLSLQFGQLPVFRGVVGKLIVREDSPWNNVRSHNENSLSLFKIDFTWAGYFLRPRVGFAAGLVLALDDAETPVETTLA